MLKRQFVSIGALHWFHTLSFSNSALRKHIQQICHYVSLDDFIDHLPYYTHVRVAPNISRARYQYHGQTLIAFTWIAPWALNFFYMMNYMELDGSFKAACRYVFSTPQGVLCNEALPLGISINLTEDVRLFEYFHNDLRSLVPPTWGPFPKRPVLSDKGGGIQAFCRHHQLRQLFCHRHLIENAKANSPLGFLVARALRERSERSYLEHRPQYLADAEGLWRAGLLSEEKVIWFTKEFLTPEFEHGLWHRMQDRISSCSNHAERFHGVVNQHLLVRNTLPARLHVMQTEIENRYRLFGEGRHRQMLAVVEHLKACNAPQCGICDDPDCLDYQKLMESRYAVDRFPCRHTVRAWGCPGAEPLRPLEKFDIEPGTHLTTEIMWEEELPAKFLAKSSVAEAIADANEQPETPAWEDGIILASGPSAPDDGTDTPHEAWELADRKIVYDIVDGVLHFRRSRRQPEELELSDVALAVWADLEASFAKAEEDSNRLGVAAECAARWWAWAREKGQARPFPPFGWYRPPEAPAQDQAH
jgi:hypothetical protein